MECLGIEPRAAGVKGLNLPTNPLSNVRHKNLLHFDSQEVWPDDFYSFHYLSIDNHEKLPNFI